MMDLFLPSVSNSFLPFLLTHTPPFVPSFLWKQGPLYTRLVSNLLCIQE